MNDNDASATKQSRSIIYKKITDDVSEDSSLNLSDQSRRKPNLSNTQVKITKLSDESITQDHLEYFDLMRRNTTAPSLLPLDTIATPIKNMKSQNPTPKPSPQSQLSLSTRELIRKANMKRVIPQQEINKESDISKILSKPSLRERFQEVSQIQSVRDLIALSKFKELVYQFEQIDQMITFLKQRRVTPFWEQIQLYILENKKLVVNIPIMQQILSIVPDLFQLSWMINEKIIRLDRWDVVVQLQGTQSLDQRIEQFKNRLLSYVQEKGEFIERYPLPIRPDIHRAQLVTDHVVAQATDKKSRAYDILRQMAENNKISQTSSLTQINLSKYKGVLKPIEGNHLSQKLLDRVREKEQKMRESEQQASGVSKQDLMVVANVIYSYYLSRQVSNMFLCNVVTYVKNQNKQVIYSEVQIRTHIETLCRINDNWIKAIDNQQGQILRMDKSIQLPHILKQIENYQE